MASSISTPLLNNPQINQESDQFHASTPTLSLSEVILEIKMLYTIAFPMIVTGLLTYGKSLVSMLFLGHLGKPALAGGSLAISLANITGYSVISGLASGTEPISSQAFGARRWALMAQTLQRTILLLLFACIPISILWLNIRPVLALFDQNPEISKIASTYLAFCLPDIFIQSFINPIKIYLRSQNITVPLMLGSGFSLVLHVPINYLLVWKTSLGVKGVALSLVMTDFVFLGNLTVYMVWAWGLGRKKRVGGPAREIEWVPILSLALPSCCSVCLEWWWYEIMIVLSGILSNAAEAVAAMGVLMQATSLAYVFPSAVGMAASTRVGNELGAGRTAGARASSTVAVSCAAATSAAAAVMMATLGGAWGRAFTGDGAVVGLTAAIMPVAGLCELGNWPQTAGCGVLRGSARPGVGVRINLGSFYGVGLPLAGFMGFGMGMGLMGLWLGLLGAQVVCAGVMIWVLSGTDWVVQANRARVLIGVELNREGEGLATAKSIY